MEAPVLNKNLGDTRINRFIYEDQTGSVIHCNVEEIVLRKFLSESGNEGNFVFLYKTSHLQDFTQRDEFGTLFMPLHSSTLSITPIFQMFGSQNYSPNH
jgi:hypothetical protein